MSPTARSRIMAGMRKHIFLAIPLVVAIIMVFWNLPGLGLSHWDEYNYVITAKWFLRSPDGTFTIYEPPGFPFMVAVFFAIFGVHDYVAIAVSAVFAIATILLVSLVGLRFFGLGVGLTAPVLLILTPLFLTYSRMALTDMAFTFFFSLTLVAMYQAAKSGRLRDIAIAGLALGSCAMTKYNGFMPLVVFVFYLACLFAGVKVGERLRVALGRVRMLLLMCIPSLVLGLLFLLMLGISAELPASQVISIHSAKLVVFSLPATLMKGFVKFNTAAVEYHAGQLEFLPLTAAPFYLQVLAYFVPVPILILSIVGLLRRGFRNTSALFVTVWILGTFFLLASTPSHYTRAMVPLLPPMALSAGLGLSRISSFLQSSKYVLTHLPKIRFNVIPPLLLVLVIALGLQGALQAISVEHRAYRDAGQLLVSVGGNSSALAQTQPVIAFYYPVAFGGINQTTLAKNRLLVIDFIAAENGYAPTLQQLREKGQIKLLATIHNDIPEEVYLDSISFEQLRQWNYTTIEIYEVTNATSTQLPGS